MQDASGLSFLVVNVYIRSQSSSTDYLDTLGVLEGFIESHQCDVVVTTGDFNVDFSRINCLTDYLSGLWILVIWLLGILRLLI